MMKVGNANYVNSCYRISVSHMYILRLPKRREEVRIVHVEVWRLRWLRHEHDVLPVLPCRLS